MPLPQISEALFPMVNNQQKLILWCHLRVPLKTTMTFVFSKLELFSYARGQVQTRVPLLRFTPFFFILNYICASWLSLFCCLTIVSIVDWMRWGWSCLSHLCNILIGQSDIVKVVAFFEPSQCTNHIDTHWTLNSYRSYLKLVNRFCWYLETLLIFHGWSIF